MMLKSALVAMLAGVVVMAASPVPAFLPQSSTQELEIPVAGSDRAAVVELRDDLDPRVADFATRFGGRWSVDWNELTGTPHMILGSGTPFTGRITSALEAEAAASRVVDANPGLFGARSADLEPTHTASGMSKWSVIYSQLYQGVPVVGGRAHVVFTEEGRLMALGSDVYPVSGVSTVPTLTEEEAVAVAGPPLGYDGAHDEITELRLVVLPLDLPGGLSYRLAYRVALYVDEPFGHWVSYVDAGDGAILGRYSLIRYATVDGTDAGDVQYVGYCDGISPLPFKNMVIEAVGEGSDTTDVDGNWSIDVAGGGPFTIETAFDGPWVWVDVVSELEASFSGQAWPGTPLDIYWDDSNARHDERDAFYNVNHIHDFMKSLDPDYTGLDYRMRCRVNMDDVCNAYYDGSGINFFREGGGCANTAEVGNVVYHEYGHGITDKLYGWQDPPGDLHEGNSDVVACFLEDTPIVGTGFYLNDCTRGIRNLSNSLTYPEDLNGEGHHDGQIIGGFHWDGWELLRVSLGEETGREVAWNIWHYGRKLGLPRNQEDQVLWTFIADDDDGNLDNGTPHHEDLCTAAQNHGFDCPEIVLGVFIIHDALGTTDDPDRSHITWSEIYSTEAVLDPDSLILYYRVNGGDYEEVLLEYDMFLDKYSGTIPTQPQSSEIDYYIIAVDELGNRKAHPGHAPDELHSFDVVQLYDSAEEETGWTLGIPGDDATAGVWECCDPEATTAQAEDDHTVDPGVNAFITHCAAGMGPGRWDVDGGATTLLSPVFNVEGLEGVVVKYFRWYTNDSGSYPGEDYWVVDISNDAGQSWVNVENTNLSEYSWYEVKFPLSDYFPTPGEVQMRFIASDLEGASNVEAGVDDFAILVNAGGETEVEAAGAPAGVPQRYALHQNNPNPFNPQTVIAYDLPRESRVSLKVYDVRGREVRTLVSATQPAGHYAFAWDGNDGSGRAAAAGVYFYRLTTDGLDETLKMILTK